MTLRDEDEVVAPAGATTREHPRVIEHRASPATDIPDKWSPRRTLVFVVGVCGLFWIMVAWFLFTWQ